MNTKTSLKQVYNYYNGTDHGVGRDSPGALLDMLAEVASQTLHSEKKWTESSGEGGGDGEGGIGDEGVTTIKLQSKSESGKRKCSQEPFFGSSQLLSMPATQLVKQFSIFTSDELKRQYSYTCALVPGCGQRYTSFASEGRARMSIKAHLADHLDYLKRDQEAYSSFTAVPVKTRNPKTNNPGSKKPRVNNQQKKPVGEALNKENKDSKAGKSTNYLRKILSNEMTFTEFEKQKTLAKTTSPNETDRLLEMKKEPDHVECQVLGDHSYYGQGRMDHNEDKLASPELGEIMVDEAMGENIMLMVVGSDGVHMKELPYIAQDISVRSDDHHQDESETIYVPDAVTWSEEVYAKNMEMSVPAKPKGKAKFIGTSKEEREMALALMERIKRKGNPAGGDLQCRICDPPRSFTAPTTLVSHYRSHAGIKPYECRICRAVFTRRHSLKYHMLIHQNQTRFTCADCGKKFRHPSHFREHRRRHTGEAPFGCEDCGQRFKTRNTYKRHLKTRHGKVLTTTGELLHLSEEDFQKVRTNPKRRAETSYSESMMDEDITAPEVIIQLQNRDCSNDAEEVNGIKQEGDDNYQSLTKGDSENNSGNELWENENENENETSRIEDDEMKDDNYRDYEYFQESQEVNKTDYAKTDITVGNCEFENVDNVVNQLRYNEEDEEDKDEENVDNDCIPIGIREDDNMQGIRLLENEQTPFDQELDPREEILYDDNVLSDRKCELIEYVQGIDITTECEEDVIAYEDGVRALEEEEEDEEGRNNYHVGNVEGETELDCFDNNLSTDNEIEYNKEVELNMERYEDMNMVEDCEESLETNIQEPFESEELIICKKADTDTEILQRDDSSDGENESVQSGNQTCYLLSEKQVVDEEDTLELEYQNRLLLQEQSPSSIDEDLPSNVAVEHIVQYRTTNYTAEESQALHNTQRIYLQTNPSSNNIIIKNKDLVSLLSQRIKLQQENPDKLGSQKSSGKVVTLLNGQPQPFNMIQKGKQGTILLLASSNEMKNSYLQIDPANTVVANGIKTLPVIAVQQK